MSNAFLGRIAIKTLFDSVLDKSDVDLAKEVEVCGEVITVAIHKREHAPYTDVEAHVGENIFKFVYKGDKGTKLNDALLHHTTTVKASEED